MSDLRRKRASKLAQLVAFDGQLLADINVEQTKPIVSILGVDEVGRGSLIGPVVAAALVFPPGWGHEADDALVDLDDSKASHLTHEKRVRLAKVLKSSAYWGIGEATQYEVETLNVSRASLLAGHRAIMQLATQFPACNLAQHLVVVDGRQTIPGLELTQRAVVKADGRSAAVAGASIIAKAHRDTLVFELAKRYPGYQWESNVGYPTPSHQQAIADLGVTPLHRKTYKVVQAAMMCQQVTLL